MKTISLKLGLFTVFLGAFFLSGSAFSDWQLDPYQSSLNFVSIKKGTVGEVHKFTRLDGLFTQSGKFTFNVHLGSVDTGIPVRDERMQEHLFAVTKYPLATVTGAITAQQFQAINGAMPRILNVELEIDLHGKKIKKACALRVLGLSNNNLVVSLQSPIIIKAEEFGLSGGVKKLKELAGLSSIAESIPITANLVFVPSPSHTKK